MTTTTTNATAVMDGVCPSCERPIPEGSRCHVFLNTRGRLMTVCSAACTTNKQCPKCLGTESPVTCTLVLGDECSACRIARIGRAPAGSPGDGLRGQPAVDARRAANENAA